MTHVSTIDKPFYYYEPITHEVGFESDSKGIQIMSIDNLPTQIPLNASIHFGNCLTPILKEYATKGTSAELKEATIVSSGSLVSRFKHLENSLIENNTRKTIYGKAELSEPMSKVLIFGSGFVSGPLIEYLSRDPCRKLTIGIFL